MGPDPAAARRCSARARDQLRLAGRLAAGLVLALALVLAGPARAAGDPAAPGQITGTVVDATGAPLAAISVAVYLGQEPGQTANVSTGADGRYDVTGLPAGDYELCFASQPGAAIEFNIQCLGYTWSSGVPVHVTSGATAGPIDMTLVPAGAISGRVTDDAGRGRPGIFVNVVGGPSGMTDSSGRYRIGVVPPGDYTVAFSAADPTSSLIPVWYAPRGSYRPTTVRVAAGQTTTGIDVQMDAGGQISGTVTDAQGNPVAGTAVFLSGAGEYGATDAAGRYTIANVEPGSYVVYFEPPDASDYLHQNYGGSPTPRSIFGGPPPYASGYTPVTVTGGATTSQVDVQLSKGAVITGTVTDQQGHPLAGVSVSAVDAGHPIFVGDTDGIKTDASGRYRIDRLGAGVYRVSFALARYVKHYYGGATAFAAATSIDVPAGATRDAIDTRMLVGGAIAGKVVDLTGRPLNAFVWAYNLDGTVAGMAPTDGTSYTIGSLAPGTYHVFFSPLAVPWPAWYDGRTSTTADPVAVVAGATTSGIDGHLAPTPRGVIGATPSRHLARFAGVLAVSPTGQLTVPLSCASACRGTATLSVGVLRTVTTSRTRARAAHRVTIGHARFGLRPSLAGSVTIRLSATGRALLRQGHGRVTATLTVTIAGQGGASTETTIAHLRSRP